MAKQRKYYGLFIKDLGQWTFAFGDFDRGNVVFERDDYRDHGVKLKDMSIITWERVPTQAIIDELLIDLNS